MSPDGNKKSPALAGLSIFKLTKIISPVEPDWQVVQVVAAPAVEQVLTEGPFAAGLLSCQSVPALNFLHFAVPCLAGQDWLQGRV